MRATRREFLSAVAGVAAACQWAGRMPGEVRAPKPTADDPLGVRPDVPVVHEIAYLDGAYITPSPQLRRCSARRRATLSASVACWAKPFRCGRSSLAWSAPPKPRWDFSWGCKTN